MSTEHEKTGLIYWDNDWPSECYTLYTTITGNGLVKLINIKGDTVHEWHMPVRPGRHAVILPNGNLGYNGSHKTSANLYHPFWDLWHGGHFMEAKPNGDIVWEHEDIYHHHDAQWLPNGNLLYTVAAEWNGNQSDIVKEVNRKGEVVWEWKIWEHIDPEEWPQHDIFDSNHWPIINGLCQTSDGLVLISLRTTSGIIAIDKFNDEIVWKIKYPYVTQQHCPVETEKGRVLCFDNGNIRPGTSKSSTITYMGKDLARRKHVESWMKRLTQGKEYSRIVEYDIDSGKLVWSYVDPMPSSFFSPYMGGVQRLWNGNTFICESSIGRLFEVTPEGKTVWEYIIPEFAEYPAPLDQIHTGLHNSCFKAHRYKEIEWL